MFYFQSKLYSAGLMDSNKQGPHFDSVLIGLLTFNANKIYMNLDIQCE